MRLYKMLCTPPRLGLAASPGGAGLAALQVYRPLRDRTRAAVDLSRRLHMAAVTPRTFQYDWVSPLLMQVQGREPHAMAVMRSSRAGRVIVGIVDAPRTLHSVVKIGPTDDLRLRHEAAVLSHPQMRRLGGGTSPKASFVETAGHCILSMQVHDAQPVEPDLWLVAALCAGMAEAGLAHGDLTPWNILVTDRGLVAVDWELASLDPRPSDAYRDLVHYVFRGGLFLDRLRPRGSVEALLGREGPGDWLLAKLGMTARQGASVIMTYLDEAQAQTLKRRGSFRRVRRLLESQGYV